MSDGPPLAISGSILQSARHVVVNGGSFVGVQNKVTVTNIHRESGTSTHALQVVGLMSSADGLDSLYKEVAPNAILNAGGRVDFANVTLVPAKTLWSSFITGSIENMVGPLE